MRTTYITFRGEADVEIEYTNTGYDPETGDIGLDWWFADLDPGELTDDEDRAVWEHVYRVIQDDDSDIREA